MTDNNGSFTQNCAKFTDGEQIESQSEEFEQVERLIQGLQVPESMKIDLKGSLSRTTQEVLFDDLQPSRLIKANNKLKGYVNKVDAISQYVDKIIKNIQKLQRNFAYILDYLKEEDGDIEI